jgi:serine/threonine protein kinase
VVQAASLFAGKDLCPGYKLIRLRGKGGYGSVWEAETPEGYSVALKFLRCEDSRAASQEIKAIQNVKQLRHPNLIRINQVWCHGGYVIVTMPLAEGSLLDLYETCMNEYQTAMTPEEVCPLLIQAADGLDFLNTRQHILGGARVAIQHCDVKPSNLLLVNDAVTLCDFGLTAVTSATLRFHRTAGTLDYAAPEIFQGRLSDATDQYSLAVTYCHLRGGLPFKDTPKTFQFGYIRSDPDLSMLTVTERPIVARALHPVPQDRWPSCKAFIGQMQKTVCGGSRR